MGTKYFFPEVGIKTEICCVGGGEGGWELWHSSAPFLSPTMIWGIWDTFVGQGMALVKQADICAAAKKAACKIGRALFFSLGLCGGARLAVSSG